MSEHSTPDLGPGDPRPTDPRPTDPRPADLRPDGRAVDPGAAYAGAATPFDPPGVVWTSVSPKLIWVRLAGAIVFLVVVVVVAVVLAVLLETWVPLLVAAPLVVLDLVSAAIVPAQVRSWGYAERQEDLLVRHGVMFRSLTVVPYGRMQYVDVNAGPLDRLLGLATVRLHTASAGTDAAVPGLSREEAARLRDRLSDAGQAQLAGL